MSLKINPTSLILDFNVWADISVDFGSTFITFLLLLSFKNCFSLFLYCGAAMTVQNVCFALPLS
jgi:hypothetical protein